MEKEKEKKVYIIIAIVVAVAVFLLWKNGVFGKKSSDDGNGGGSSGGSGYDPADTLEGVISASGMSRADAASVRQFDAAVEKDTMNRRANIEDKANANGYTYYQQLALDALWVKYHSDDGWAAGTPWKVISAIQTM